MRGRPTLSPAPPPQSNDAGTPFPIWGTCLGHQLLQIIVTGAHFGDLLVETDAVSQPSTLNLTAAAPASRLFADLYEERPTLVAKLGDPAWNLAMENHEFGLPTANFFSPHTLYPQLAAEFDVLSTSVDRGGIEYVSTIEHKKYPFWGVQARSEGEGDGGGARAARAAARLERPPHPPSPPPSGTRKSRRLSLATARSPSRTPP